MTTSPPAAEGREDEDAPEEHPERPPADLVTPPGPKPPAAPRPVRYLGNRDWIIPIECLADGAVLKSAGQRFAAAELAPAAGESPLLRALRQMIARRQATVRPGDPPYRPQVRFLVRPDGLRTYHLAYPSLEALGVRMSRQNVDPTGGGEP